MGFIYLMSAVIGVALSVALSSLVKRVERFEKKRVSSGTYDVVYAICVSEMCVVDYSDIDGSYVSNMVLNRGDLVVGGVVSVKSGELVVYMPVEKGFIQI